MSPLAFSLGIPLSFIALASGVRLATTSEWGVFGDWRVPAKPALPAGVLTVFRSAGPIRTNRTAWRGSQ
jgi:hypothetical protein